MSDSRDTASEAATYTLRSRAAKARSWIASSTCRSTGGSASVVGEPSTGAPSVDRTCEQTPKCGGCGPHRRKTSNADETHRGQWDPDRLPRRRVRSAGAPLARVPADLGDCLLYTS